MDESLDVISGENQIKIHSDENDANDANDANDETIKIEAGIRQNWIESNVERQRETFGQNVRKKLWRHFRKGSNKIEPLYFGPKVPPSKKSEKNAESSSSSSKSNSGCYKVFANSFRLTFGGEIRSKS